MAILCPNSTDIQSEDGDPSRDVAVASVLFLVDGKLVLLQPSTTEEGHLKYDMRIIAQTVEYFILTRDQSSSNPLGWDDDTRLESVVNGQVNGGHPQRGLQDSLWIFDGTDMRVWANVQDIIQPGSADVTREFPPSIQVPMDFYPLSALLNKGIILGLDSELIQRRDVDFAFFRLAIRVRLFVFCMINC